jgi:hypothetical protein
MTQDEIIEITRQAGGFDATPEFLERFANLVAAKEREKCAFLCDELWRKGGWDYNAGYAATRIRARGEA